MLASREVWIINGWPQFGQWTACRQIGVNPGFAYSVMHKARNLRHERSDCVDGPFRYSDNRKKMFSCP